MPRTADPATRHLWQQRLQRFSRSGLTVAAFCDCEGISAASFYAWRRRLRGDAPADTHFVPVRLVAPPSAPAELLLPSGCVLRLSPDCDLAWVRQLLAALGVPPC